VAYAVLLAVGLLGALTFIIRMAARSPGWWRTGAGRWVMAQPACLAGLLALALIGRVLHWPPAVWLTAFSVFDGVEWFGVVLLIRAQRDNVTEG
jgi:hypothetical protein